MDQIGGSSLDFSSRYNPDAQDPYDRVPGSTEDLEKRINSTNLSESAVLPAASSRSRQLLHELPQQRIQTGCALHVYH